MSLSKAYRRMLIKSAARKLALKKKAGTVAALYMWSVLGEPPELEVDVHSKDPFLRVLEGLQ